MSKYHELCKKLNKTQAAFETAKSTLEYRFVADLCNYLGCKPDLIHLELSPPEIITEDNKKVINICFMLTIELVATVTGVKELKRLDPFSSNFSKENDDIYYEIEYRNILYLKKTDETMNELFDVIFKDIQNELLD